MLSDDTEYLPYSMGFGSVGALFVDENAQTPRRKPPMGFGVIATNDATEEPELWAILRGEA